MTNYLLHGGMTGYESKHNDEYFCQMFELSGNGKILACYYARPREIWEELLEGDRERFKKAADGKEFELILGSEDAEELANQMKEAGTIYFRGGNTKLLMEKLSLIRAQLPELFFEKTISGSSAGAMMLAKYSCAIDHPDVLEGFGILPIKVFVHYFENQKDNLEKLNNYKENLEIYTIPETEFVIIEQ